LFRYLGLGNNQYDYHDSFDVWDEEGPSASANLLISHEDFNLYLKSNYVKEYVFIKTSYSSHCPFFSTICDASTCDRDTPCSSSSSSDELTSQSTKGGEIIHDENEKNQTIEYYLHPSRYLLLHEDNSPNHLVHKISPIHLSSDFRSEEYFDLSSLVIEDENVKSVTNMATIQWRM